MKTSDYKKKFIELFKQMEEELGECAEVSIERENSYDLLGRQFGASYKCIMKF